MREFLNQHPKNCERKVRDGIVLEYKYQWNVDLKEENPPDFGCFLSAHDGLFSIKIKVSYNAEIFLYVLSAYSWLVAYFDAQGPIWNFIT